ncbi:MAG: VCBS repeat-containing protein [Anaerolineae bacterium]|nr:VCBS repeat-containing protein [Anaerolineae bacterium]
MINKQIIQIARTLALALGFITTSFMLLGFQATFLLAQSDSVPSSNQKITTASGANLVITEGTTVQQLFSTAVDLSPTDNSSVIAANNAVNLSQTPAFTSNLPSSPLSMDWGDVDRDGDLDLALGSQFGTAVYLNEDGILTQKWSVNRPTLEVRWFAYDSDDNLELIVVGNSAFNQPSGTGYNYIYTQPETDNIYTFFYSPYQLLHVAPGDYDGNGQSDLIITTNLLKPTDDCPIYLIKDIFSLISQIYPTPTRNCLPNQATASISPADFNNDGKLDLAASQIQNGEFGVYENAGGASFTFTSIIDDLSFPASDAAWGDYDSDGYLDLAMALPYSKEVRIYSNDKGIFASPTKILSSSLFLTPLTVDWADFNNDGKLDLAVAEMPPKIYDGASDFDQVLATLNTNALTFTAHINNLRGIDLDDDLDLDLALTNEVGPALVFKNSIPHLTTNLTSISTVPSESVDWGDANNDGYLDLLFGGRLHFYSATTGQFNTASTIIDSNAKISMFGEMVTDSNGTNYLDILLATSNDYKLYKSNNGNFASGQVWNYPSSASVKSMALGYLNNDSRVDILLGNGQDNSSQLANLAFLNDYKIAKPAPSFSWSSNETGQLEATYDLAWADYNHDGYLDYAAANGTNGVRIYRNNIDLSFSLAASIPSKDARAVAWVDYNADSFPDLTVGNFEAANRIYKNENGNGTFTDKWNSNDNSKTTSLAWADWDNDNDLDLAVGNDGQDQIFKNTGSSEPPKLQVIWRSLETNHTTGIAWGDKDGDGDLDLAVSQTGAGAQNGVYENHTIWPSHLANNSFNKYMPLPRNPSYVVINRPGTEPDAFSYSSGELIGYNPQNSSTDPIMVAIDFQLFDPDGEARGGDLNTPGDPVYNNIKYEYSMNGGGSWTDAISQSPTTETARGGEPHTLIWEPPNETSDNALFRITVIHQKPTGPVQRAKTVTVSPPFRLRPDNCNWPANPSINIVGDQNTGSLIQFIGNIEPRTGEGQLEFKWDFDNGEEPGAGQLRNIRYDTVGQKTVVLTVTAKAAACNKAKATAIRNIINIGTTSTSILNKNKVYIPLIIKAGSNTSQLTSIGTNTSPQVTELQGRSTVTATHLVWSSSLGTEAIAGYRVYRATAGKTSLSFALLANLPAETTHYTDPTATCEQIYFVTAYTVEGESNASSTSYYSPGCAP